MINLQRILPKYLRPNGLIFLESNPSLHFTLNFSKTNKIFKTIKTRKMETSTENVIYIGSDHAGYDLKEILKKHLESKKYKVEDVGTYSSDRCDYPDYAAELCKKLTAKGDSEKNLGVLVCGSGVGISIAANKFKGIRCALCHDSYTAQMAKSKDHCNVIALGGRVTGSEVAKQCLDVFLESPFEDDPAYLARVQKIKDIEEANLAQ